MNIKPENPPDEPPPIPLVAPSYRKRVEAMVTKFAAELAANPDSLYARAWLAGWQAELARLERGGMY